MVHDTQLPMTATQLVGHGVEAITNRLTPVALGVLLLNLVGIGAAVYFLNVLIVGQQQHLENLLNVQQAQITQVLHTHDREFDTLMAMVAKAYEAAREPPPSPLPPPDIPLPKGKSQ
jgi:hypothetical protein